MRAELRRAARSNAIDWNETSIALVQQLQNSKTEPSRARTQLTSSPARRVQPSRADLLNAGAPSVCPRRRAAGGELGLFARGFLRALPAIVRTSLPDRRRACGPSSGGRTRLARARTPPEHAPPCGPDRAGRGPARAIGRTHELVPFIGFHSTRSLALI